MRSATQQDLDCKAQELVCIIETLQFYDADAIFKTFKELNTLGVENYTGEEILDLYAKHHGGDA